MQLSPSFAQCPGDEDRLLSRSPSGRCTSHPCRKLLCSFMRQRRALRSLPFPEVSGSPGRYTLGLFLAKEFRKAATSLLTWGSALGSRAWGWGWGGQSPFLNFSPLYLLPVSSTFFLHQAKSSFALFFLRQILPSWDSQAQAWQSQVFSARWITPYSEFSSLISVYVKDRIRGMWKSLSQSDCQAHMIVILLQSPMLNVRD